MHYDCMNYSSPSTMLFVRLLGMTQDLSVPAPIARYQAPHLIQNCKIAVAVDFRYLVGGE